MKRDWNLIREILIAFEEDRFVEYVNNTDLNDYELRAYKMKSAEMGKEEAAELWNTMLIKKRKSIWKHMEMMQDCGLLVSTKFDDDNSNYGLRLTMQGADLLDTLRNEKLWPQILKKTKETGFALTWEFIKAAIPAVIKSQI